MSEPQNIPCIAIGELDLRSASLHERLLTMEGLPTMPFRLEIGHSSFKITEENRDAIALGMLLQMTVKDRD